VRVQGGGMKVLLKKPDGRKGRGRCVVMACPFKSPQRTTKRRGNIGANILKREQTKEYGKICTFPIQERGLTARLIRPDDNTFFLYELGKKTQKGKKEHGVGRGDRRKNHGLERKVGTCKVKLKRKNVNRNFWV